MARSTATLAHGSHFAIFPSTLRLALWRLRQTWRLLLGVGLGIVVAVMLVCAAPLFSQVTTTGGLRGAFAAAPTSAGITINATTTNLQFQNIQEISTLADESVQSHVGNYLKPGNEFSTQLPIFPLLTVSQGTVSRDINEASVQVVGYDEAQFSPHATLLAGRLPRLGTTNVEIALTKATAADLGATVGSIIWLNTASIPQIVTDAEKVPLAVVGIIAVNDEDAFFHQAYFEPQKLQYPIGAHFYQVIAANDDLSRYLQTPSVAGALGERTTTQFFWYYALDPARLDAATLDTLIAQANALQVELPDALLGLDASPSGSVFGAAFAALADYQARINALQVPITFLLVLVLVFVLFFVSVMTEIIVDRQADAIAILRSRGVSRLQIFGALMTQSLGVGVIALAIGPPLAFVAVLVAARLALSPQNQGALNLLTAHPLQTAYDLPWLAIAVVAVAVGAMIIAINRATAADVLTMRREAARATRKPVWQRLNLDVAAAIIALTGAILYALVLDRINPALQYQFGFLSVVAPSFVLLAGTLLFFRLYPFVLRGAAWVAGRGRGSVPMLALAQMARSPRQSMRTTLLLAFAMALMIFALIFGASQTQHLRAVASFTAGADFSGALPGVANPLTPLSDRMAPYSQIPGATSVALGFVAILPPNAGNLAYTQQLLAVDADHFAQTATWDAGNSTPSLGSLMAQLVNQRDAAKTKGVVPAILNGSLWDALHLTPGTEFSLLVPGFDAGQMRFVAIQRVAHIQSVYDSAQFFTGGLLVDYQSFATVFTQIAQLSPPQPNFIWLRSASDAASVASVRAALTSGDLKLVSLVDRRALTQTLLTDPLQVDLSGVLTVGAIAALILALVGMLIASWLNARSRLTNFAVLRAVGAAPRQIAGVLIWEQSITYGVALALGALLGALLSAMLLPVLATVNARTQGGDLIGAANLPAIQMIAPVGALAVALGTLVAICVGALVVMTVVVARPSVSATLRLNED